MSESSKSSALNCARAAQLKDIAPLVLLRYLEYDEQLKGHTVWEGSVSLKTKNCLCVYVCVCFCGIFVIALVTNHLRLSDCEVVFM